MDIMRRHEVVKYLSTTSTDNEVNLRLMMNNIVFS